MLSSINKYSNLIFVIVLWLIVTTLNLNKSFHIDDTAYLEVAKWIEKNPTQPLSGKVDWSDKLEFDLNDDDQIKKPSLFHPPLFLYIISIWGKLFSYNEISLHFLMSFFTLWILLRFNNILDILNKPNKKFIIISLSCCPVFILNHNIMLDIPLLAFILEFFYWTINPKCSDKKSFILSSIFFSLGSLIKYSAIPLIGKILIKILYKKNVKNILWLLIPLIFFSSWMIFNLYDFGAIHFFILPSNPIWFSKYIQNLVGYFAYFGSISIFLSILLYKEYLESKNFILKFLLLISIYISILVPLIIVLNVFFNFNESLLNLVLFYIFIINGCIIFLLLIKQIIKRFLIKFNFSELILIYWIVSLSFFSIFFAPFLAARHIILILPAILLTFDFQFKEFNKRKLKYITLLFLSLIPSFTYVMSDISFSNIYKKEAKKISIEFGDKNEIWFNGTWGWKFYAEENNMKYLKDISEIKSNDYLVVPKKVSGSFVPKDINLSLIKEIKIKNEFFYENFSTIWFYSYFPFNNKKGKVYNYNKKGKFYNLEEREIFAIYRKN